MIPDLMEAEIYAFFTNQDEMEITPLVAQHSVANPHKIRIVMQKISNLPVRQLGHHNMGYQ